MLACEKLELGRKIRVVLPCRCADRRAATRAAWSCVSWARELHIAYRV